MFTVLVPVDTDENRAKRSANVVTNFPIDSEEIEIVILSVFKEFDVVDGDGGAVSSDEVFDEDELPESVRVAASLFEERGFSPAIRREHGDVVDTILRTADEIGADQIVMTGRNRSPVGKAVFGSTIQGVLSSGEVPVTVTLV